MIKKYLQAALVVGGSIGLFSPISANAIPSCTDHCTSHFPVSGFTDNHFGCLRGCHKFNALSCQDAHANKAACHQYCDTKNWNESPNERKEGCNYACNWYYTNVCQEEN